MRSFVGILGCCQVLVAPGGPSWARPAPSSRSSRHGRSGSRLVHSSRQPSSRTASCRCTIELCSAVRGAVQPLLAAGLKGGKLGCLTHPRARTCGGARAEEPSPTPRPTPSPIATMTAAAMRMNRVRMGRKSAHAEAESHRVGVDSSDDGHPGAVIRTVPAPVAGGMFVMAPLPKAASPGRRDGRACHG